MVPESCWQLVPLELSVVRCFTMNMVCFVHQLFWPVVNLRVEEHKDGSSSSSSDEEEEEEEEEAHSDDDD